MQAIRRSDRLRNRFGGIAANAAQARGSASMPNLRIMDGQAEGHNAADNGNRRRPIIIPDIGDLIPDEIGQGDAASFYSEDHESFFASIFRKRWVKSLAIVLVIFLAVLVAELFTLVFSKQQRLDMTVNSVHSNLLLLERKLRKLNKGVDEFMEWRENMKIETTKVKKDTLSECSKQLEKFHTKIEEALTLYDADKVGMIDYALESAGGYVTSILDTIPAPSHLSYNIMGLLDIHYPSNPRLLIQPGTLPGQCFAFKGSHGRIRIRLAHSVNITAITIEHAHQNLVGNMNSAPKDFKVYGLEEASSLTGNELGMFTYSLKKAPLQIFYLQKTNQQRAYRHVELHILTNQGNLEYTCIYRFRVHGDKVEFLE